jgi:hypothetical protein
VLKDSDAAKMSGTACGMAQHHMPVGRHLQHHCENFKLAVLYLFMIHVVYDHGIKKYVLRNLVNISLV